VDGRDKPDHDNVGINRQSLNSSGSIGNAQRRCIYPCRRALAKSGGRFSRNAVNASTASGLRISSR